MANWKWREEKKTVNSIEVVDFGWYCEACGFDLGKHLRESGFENARNMILMKRNKPALAYCPCCGDAKE